MGSILKKKDIELIENVQRHLTKYIIGMNKLPFELPSLDYRLRGDIILVFKIVKGEYDQKRNTSNNLFTTSTRNKNTLKHMRREEIEISIFH